MKIFVDSEKDKQELIQASRHIHNSRYELRKLPGLNTLAHLYCNPDIIEVKENQNVESHSSENANLCTFLGQR